MSIDELSSTSGENEDDLVLSNGIDFETGEPLLPPLPVKDVSTAAQGGDLADILGSNLQRRHEEISLRSLGVAEVDDQNNLNDCGWGVLFAQDLGDDLADIRKALGPLLTLRRQQAGLYREFVGNDAYEPSESAIQFAARHGQGPNLVDPEKMPFYILLVGSPRQIPFLFQYQLAVQFAVGRIFFDTIDEYERYAESVVAAETGEIVRARRFTAFGVKHDRATDLSVDQLIKPLVARLLKTTKAWDIRTLLEEQATKVNLVETLRGEKAPALLLTASHGIGFRNGHPLQRDTQGALLCQEFPTGGLRKSPKPQHYFAASDVQDDLDIAGLVAFFFACYGAGTPQADDFAHHATVPEKTPSEEAFMARLPQRLLAKATPDGKQGAGALAVVGQVERAWATSFHWGRVGSSITHFREAFRCLMKGHRIGWAMDPFSSRYALLAADLNDTRSQDFGVELDEDNLARLWTAVNDARSYATIGDPAVRLAAEKAAVEPSELIL